MAKNGPVVTLDVNERRKCVAVVFWNPETGHLEFNPAGGIPAGELMALLSQWAEMYRKYGLKTYGE